MTIYHGIVRGGSHVVHCDRLDDFFKEFIEYRKWKSKTNVFNKDTVPFKEWKKATNYHPHNPEKDWYWAIFYLSLDNDKTKNPIVYWERPSDWETSFDYSNGWDLGINVSKAFKIKKDELLESNKWKQWNQQKEKIEKVLKDIWETGKTKDTYDLDLNWPVSVNQNSQLINESDRTKPKEDKQENKTEWPIRKHHQKVIKIVWIIISILAVSFFLFLLYWLWKRLKTKKE